MKREDANGFWEIEDNPISCAGVYPYLGAHLPGAPDPSRVYMVLRPPEELGKPETVDSFKLQPWTIGHEMLGPKEKGLTPPEDKGVHGVIGEKVWFDETADPPTLYGNIKVFSEALKDETARGVKQLSAGYFHDVEWTGGVWNGQAYDAIQRNISGNHLASVPEGRMGPGVAVMDSTVRGFDPNPFTLKFSNKEDSMSFEELSKMIEALIARVKALEESKGSAAPGAAAGTDNGGAAGKDTAGAAGTDTAGQETPGAAGKDNANATGKDEGGADPGAGAEPSLEALAEALKALAERLDRLEGNGAAGGDNADAATKDEEGAEPGKEEKPKGGSMDAALLHKRILKDMAGRDALFRDLVPHVGSFDHSLMTEQEVAAYGCAKLKLPVTKGHESTAIRAYLKGAGTFPSHAFSMDAGGNTGRSAHKSAKINAYLKEGQ